MILYCGGGFRSALAADNLQKMGYTNVISLDGGWRAYRLQGCRWSGSAFRIALPVALKELLRVFDYLRLGLCSVKKVGDIERFHGADR